MRIKPIQILILFFALLVVGFITIFTVLKGKEKPANKENSSFDENQNTPAPTITLTPTPKPLTFSEMNQRYGPCAIVPALMYHHIQDEKNAKKLGQSNLSVNPQVFHEHLTYLRDKGYKVISMKDIIDFFASGTPLPIKPALLTFDDGYEDFYFNAFPILKEFNYPATLFLPTGLVDNAGYLLWVEITEISNSGLVLFANHTWSHQSTVSNKEIIEKEISLADKQLLDRGLNKEKAFAYPYGSESQLAENYLRSLNYNLAFTTHIGSTLCKKLNLSLPRIRIGNVPLSVFGL